MNKKEFSKMSLGLDLLNDLPNIEVINNGNLNYYKAVDITDGELTVVNMSDDNDEFYLSIENLYAKIEGFGTIINYKDYLQNLEEVFVEQKIINSK